MLDCVNYSFEHHVTSVYIAEPIHLPEITSPHLVVGLHKFMSQQWLESYKP